MAAFECNDGESRIIFIVLVMVLDEYSEIHDIKSFVHDLDWKSPAKGCNILSPDI